MKYFTLAFLATALLFQSGCSMLQHTTKVGMTEKNWLYHTYANDLVYIDGNVKAYRASGSYYYFKDGKLVKVATSLLSADKV